MHEQHVSSSLDGAIPRGLTLGSRPRPTAFDASHGREPVPDTDDATWRCSEGGESTCAAVTSVARHAQAAAIDVANPSAVEAGLDEAAYGVGHALCLRCLRASKTRFAAL